MNALKLCTSLIVVLTGCNYDKSSEATSQDVETPTAAKNAEYDMANALDSPTMLSPELSGAERNWTYNRSNKTATYSVPGGGSAISLRCEENTLGNRKLVFNWNVTAPQDQNQTVSMRWGSDAETFAVEPVRVGSGGSVSDWRAIFEPTSEEANFLLIATSPITFTFGALGEPKVIAPASERLEQAIHDCQ